MNSNGNDGPNIPTEVLAETENYSVWTAQEPDGETTYHLEVNQVTVHFFEEEWVDFVQSIHEAVADGSADEDGSDEAVEVELDWGTLYFLRDEWNEFVKLIEQTGA